MAKKIRVAILSDSPLPALRDGAQGRGAGQGATWLPPLARAFGSYEDLDITWISLSAGKESAADECHHGQRFLVIPHLQAAHDLRLRYLPARWRLRALLRKIRPDVVHVWGSERCYPAILKGMGIPSLYSIQGNLTKYAEIGGLTDNWFWKAQAKFESMWVQHATMLACESPWSADIAKGYWPSLDVRVVEWGVHPRFYDVPWQPRQEEPYLLYCGGFDWRKGVDVLFEALTMIPNRNWVLRLAGEGELREPYEARNLPRVEWLGNLKWDQLTQQMAGAWGLLVPTRADTGPSVVKEARVIGLPVIGSRNGGLRDYITSGVNGLHVEPLDAENLAHGLQEFMQDFSRVQEMGRAQHEADRAYFRPERAAAIFHQLYQELASTQSR